MSNLVFLNSNGHIEQRYEGDQTSESVSNVVAKTGELIRQLQSQGKPINVLTDLSQLGRSSAGSRKVSAEALKTMPYSKVALYGANFFMKHVANLIIFASGKSRSVRYFDARDQATEWLGTAAGHPNV